MIELRNITKSFGTGPLKRIIIDDVSLVIEAGEFTTISAPSGSGKSTLLNLIGCLYPADSGELLVDGVDTKTMSDSALALFRNQRIGFIFQSYHLIPVLNAVENVAYPLALQGLSRKERQERSRDMLRGVGLEDHVKKRPKHLSGGQRQRVAIARALICNPKIVLADEPSANLDAETAQEIIALMERLNQQSGSTFLISTHDPRVAQYAKKRLTIENKKLVELHAA